MHDRTRPRRSWEISRHCQSSLPKERAVPCCCIEAGCPDIFLLNSKMATRARHLYMLSRAGWESLIPKIYLLLQKGRFSIDWSGFVARPCIFAKPRCILLLHSRWQIHDEDRNAQGVCSFKTNSKRVCSSDQTSTQGSETRDRWKFGMNDTSYWI